MKRNIENAEKWGEGDGAELHSQNIGYIIAHVNLNPVTPSHRKMQHTFTCTHTRLDWGFRHSEPISFIFSTIASDDTPEKFTKGEEANSNPRILQSSFKGYCYVSCVVRDLSCLVIVWQTKLKSESESEL